MRIINAQFDVNSVQYDKTLSSTYLLILQNMSAFSNAHSTLLSLDIILLLRQIASLAAKDQNAGKFFISLLLIWCDYLLKQNWA